MIILKLLLVILGSICYRLGGSSFSDFPKLPKWLVKSYTRDVGIPLVSLLYMYISGEYHWSLWLCLPLMYAALTTYFKCLNKYFHDTTEDAHWYNFLAHGFMIGIAFIPYGIALNVWPMVLIRAVLMALFMMVWSEINDNVNMEEFGRGAIIVATLGLL